jgi:hypothetical protein
MKLVRILTITAVLALIASTAARAAEGDSKGPRGGHGPALDHLLPAPLLGELSLTADQKTQYDSLEAAFKKDAADWSKAHPDFQDQMHKAQEAGDKATVRTLREARKPLMDSRKGYIDKLRVSLTDAQKATLDKAREDMQGRRGERNGKGDAPKGPPPPPPAD